MHTISCISFQWLVSLLFPLILKNHGAFPTGHRCGNHNNPADFFLDVIIENEEADGPLGNLAT